MKDEKKLDTASVILLLSLAAVAVAHLLGWSERLWLLDDAIVLPLVVLFVLLFRRRMRRRLRSYLAEPEPDCDDN